MFSYVISHRTSTEDRKRNLDYLISYINNNFENVDIIVVEQDSEEKYFNINCRKVLFKDNGPFKRSACLNIGYNNAKFNKILFADNDLLIPRDQIIESLNRLDEYDSVNPYEKVRDMDEYSTIQLINVDNFSAISSYSERGGIVFSGGACFFTREGYAKIGGYDEEFIGWGGEDNACSHKIEYLLTSYEIKGHCWHMSHSRVMSNEVHPDYNNNIIYLNKLISMNIGELIKECEHKRKTHGW